MKNFIFLIFSILLSSCSIAQDSIPSVYKHIYYDKEQKLYHSINGEKYYAVESNTKLSLKNLQGDPRGTSEGLSFDFNDEKFSGTLYYGLINYNDSKHPMPVWYKRTSKIENGKTSINISGNLSGKYDMTNWQNRGKGTMGYRVTNLKGKMLYEGIIGFIYDNTGIFHIGNTITEGPFINLLEPDKLTISFNTNSPIKAKIKVDGKTYVSKKSQTHHEIEIDGLQPDTEYAYVIDYGHEKQQYSFKTAPVKGSKSAFVFAYTSDSRAGQGGGERDMYGANYYVMRKISALARSKDVAFMQFTGDMINGYSISKEDINLQYANWKRAIEPYAHYFPIIAGMGNHEVVGYKFLNAKGRWKAFIPGFPFETESPSAIFASNFVNPISDLKSEDDTYYDPDPEKIDFPPYDETVFHYIYGNVAIIVLNSDYFYAPSIKNNPSTGGNLHGYLMDNQLKWLEKTLLQLENDVTIDHIFVTHHTPIFPNGGHVHDDMWYNGSNKPRPTIAGVPVKKGILERRDEYLDLLINKSSKVIATMTGDEHNYNKVKVTPDVNIYPDNYDLPKLKRSRTLWQINNGSAGAPYYAQDKSTPWTKALSGFTTQQALVLVYVAGKEVRVEVMNPDTLEMIDEYVLRK